MKRPLQLGAGPGTEVLVRYPRSSSRYAVTRDTPANRAASRNDTSRSASFAFKAAAIRANLLPGLVRDRQLSAGRTRAPYAALSIDSLNRNMPICTVAAITTTDKSRSRVCFELPEGEPCERRSWVMPFQVMTISQERLLTWIGALTDRQKAELKARLRLVWDL